MPALRWQGDPLAALLPHRSNDGPVLDAAEATLLPDPAAAVTALREAFLFRGTKDNDPTLPAFRVGDVVAVANYITAALHNNLPTPDRRDTATIWDKWRKAVLRIRKETQSLLASDRYGANNGKIYELGADLDALEYDLVTAFKSPSEISRYYCPWAADFFTYERLHPEAV